MQIANQYRNAEIPAMAPRLRAFLIRHYWVFIVRGFLGALFGLEAILVWPILEFDAFGFFFALFIFVDGMVMVAVLVIQWDKRSWMLFFDGLTGMLIGIFLYFGSGINNRAFFLLVGFWAIFVGVLRLLIAVNLRGLISGVFMLGCNAVTSIAFGVFLAIGLEKAIVPLSWLVAVYALFQGSFLFFCGIMVRWRPK